MLHKNARRGRWIIEYETEIGFEEAEARRSGDVRD